MGLGTIRLFWAPKRLLVAFSAFFACGQFFQIVVPTPFGVKPTEPQLFWVQNQQRQKAT